MRESTISLSRPTFSLDHTQADMNDIKEKMKTMKKNNEHLEAIKSKVNDIKNLIDTVERQVKRSNVKMTGFKKLLKKQRPIP